MIYMLLLSNLTMQLDNLAFVPSDLQQFFVGGIIDGVKTPISFNPNGMSLSHLDAAHPTHFDIPSNELVYALTNRWGADTLNITGSARVYSFTDYRVFCFLFDAYLRKCSDSSFF